MAASTQTGKTKAKQASTARSTAGPDAITLLKTDHKEVKGWFQDYEKTESDARKAKLSEQICLALKVHMQVEEEYFYPASRQVLDTADEELVDEAIVEHAGAKQLIAEIEAMEVGEDLYDAKVKVLGEQIDHHVEEEETDYFPKVRKTDLDLKALGAQMAARKAELMTQLRRPNGRPVQ